MFAPDDEPSDIVIGVQHVDCYNVVEDHRQEPLRFLRGGVESDSVGFWLVIVLPTLGFLMLLQMYCKYKAYKLNQVRIEGPNGLKTLGGAAEAAKIQQSCWNQSIFCSPVRSCLFCYGSPY